MLQQILAQPQSIFNSASEREMMWHNASILYKLHLECGRMINLHDWFVAFRTVLQSSEHYKQDEKREFVRFIQGVSELQYLGFIKPTNRKTDHVVRLTWSNT
jgi:origin recognition complex subunit 3